MARSSDSSQNSSTGTRARKAVVGAAAGSIPLLALLVGTAVLPTSTGGPSDVATQRGAAAVKCESDIEDFNTCHSDYPTGCSAAGKYDGALNLIKNQLPRPKSDNVPVLDEPAYKKLEQKIPSGLAKSNHADFAEQLKALGEEEIHGVVGFLYYAKVTGAESSNCGLTGEENVDFHIGIGFDGDLASRIRQSSKLSASDRKDLTQTSVIVEMTPHYRAFFEPDWTIDAVKAAIGKKVKVIGQLMIDNEHNVPSQNCGFSDNPDPKCWRASVWELHPVTGFFVCDRDDNACDANSTDWAELGKTKADRQTASVTQPSGTRSRRGTR